MLGSSSVRSEQRNPDVVQMINSKNALKADLYDAVSEGGEKVTKQQVDELIDGIQSHVVTLLETHREITVKKCQKIASSFYEELMKTPLPKVSAETSEKVVLSQASYAEDVCRAYFSVRQSK